MSVQGASSGTRRDHRHTLRHLCEAKITGSKRETFIIVITSNELRREGGHDLADGAEEEDGGVEMHGEWQVIVCDKVVLCGVEMCGIWVDV